MQISKYKVPVSNVNTINFSDTFLRLNLCMLYSLTAPKWGICQIFYKNFSDDGGHSGFHSDQGKCRGRSSSSAGELFLGETCPPNFSFNVTDFNYQIFYSKSLTMIKKRELWQFRSLLSCIFVVVTAWSYWDRDSGREATHPGSLHTSTSCW